MEKEMEEATIIKKNKNTQQSLDYLIDKNKKILCLQIIFLFFAIFVILLKLYGIKIERNILFNYYDFINWCDIKSQYVPIK